MATQTAIAAEFVARLTAATGNTAELERLGREVERIALNDPARMSVIMLLHAKLGPHHSDIYKQSREYTLAAASAADARAMQTQQADVSFFSDWRYFAAVVTHFANDNSVESIRQIRSSRQTIVVAACMFIAGMRFSEIPRARVVTRDDGSAIYHGCQKGKFAGTSAELPFESVVQADVVAAALDKLRTLYDAADVERARARWAARFQRKFAKGAHDALHADCPCGCGEFVCIPGATAAHDHPAPGPAHKHLKLPRVAAGIIIGRVLLEKKGLAPTPVNLTHMTNLVIHHAQRPGDLSNSAPYC